jgi:hypothetical protein
VSSPVIHILNGDALGDQFPKNLPGKTLVFRECLIEGPKKVVGFKAFFDSRATYLSDTYDPKIKESYSLELSVPLMRLVTGVMPSEVVLWFEEDLFCQTNFWFVCYFLLNSGFGGKVSWAKPSGTARYNFGLLSKESLTTVFENRLLIDVAKIAPLWQAYSIDDSDELIRLVRELPDLSEYIIPAASAYHDMNTSTVEQSRPYLSLLEIIKTLKTTHFGKVFMAFCQKEAVYGLGDLQVKRIFDEVVRSNPEIC